MSKKDFNNKANGANAPTNNDVQSPMRETELTTKEESMFTRMRDIGTQILIPAFNEIKGCRKGQKGKPEMIQSAMKRKAVASMVRDYLRATESLVRNNVNETWFPEDKRGMPQVDALGPYGFNGETRTITNLDLLMGLCVRNPLPLIKVPVERDYNVSQEEGFDRNHIALLEIMIDDHDAPFWECGGLADFGLGPVMNMLMFGGNETAGSHARAEASIASLSQVKDMTQLRVYHVNLSCPETVHQSLIEDTEAFYRPYMEKAIRNGLEAIVDTNGVNYTQTFNKNYMSLNKDERANILKSHSSWNKDQDFEIDGEVWCSPSIFDRFNLSVCSAAQFRAVPRLKPTEVNTIIHIVDLWKKEMLKMKGSDDPGQSKEIIKRANQLVSYFVTKSIDKGLLRTSGYFKGLITPINGIKKDVVLMDINAGKGRNKSAIKVAVKDMIENGASLVYDDVCLGIIQSLGYDVDDKSSIVPVVQPSWQTTFLLQDGDIEAGVQRHIDLINKGFNDLINDGVLHQYFKTILLSNKLIDKDLEPVDGDEEGLAQEEQDVLDLVIKEHNNMMESGINMCAHPKITKMIRTNVLKYLRAGKFSVMPLGQTEEFFGENRVSATRSYIATAPELPMDGYINVGGRQIKAAAIYHPDTRWHNSVGLLWRYPIMKNTTIMPCIFLPMPKERMINGKMPSVAYMNSETVKQFLVGDTDGDQVCFMRYHIEGAKDYKVSKNGFTFTIDRPEGSRDDMDLLGAYASILDDEPTYKLPVLHDPVEYLDNDPQHLKQPLQIDWSAPGEAAMAAHTSKKGVGSVALMYWGITSLNTEVQQLRLLINDGKFEAIKYGHHAVFGRKGNVNVDKANKSLDIAEKIIGNLYGWAALQGEASVCGAKYDMLWHALKAMTGALKDMEGMCNWCVDGKKVCKKIHTQKCTSFCAAHNFHNVMKRFEALGDIDQYSAEDLHKHSDLLDHLGAIYTVLMDRVINEINIVRKLMADKVKQHRQNRIFNVIRKNDTKDPKTSPTGKDITFLNEYTLHWSVRYDDKKMRMMDSISGSAFVGKSAAQLSHVIDKLVDTPSFMHNIFSRMMSVFGRGVQELHGYMKDKDSKAKTNAKNMRISWGTKFASYNNNNQLIPYSDLVNVDQYNEINVLLKTFDVMTNNRALRSELADVKIAWVRDDDPQTKAGNVILDAINNCENYGEMKYLGELVRWIATGLGSPKVRTYKTVEGTFLPDTFICKPIKILGVDYADVFTTFGRKAEFKFVKNLIEVYLEKESSMWKEIQELFYNSFDSWCAHASKAQVEVMWRVGHLDGIMDVNGKAIERVKDQWGNVIVSGTAKYISGETLALKALGTHMTKFIGTVKRVLMNSETFSPVAICAANKEDKHNYETRNPEKGMIVKIKYTEADVRFEIDGPNGEKWFIFNKVNHKSLKDLHLVAPEWFTVGDWEDDFIISDIKAIEMVRKDGTPNLNNRIFACTIKKADNHTTPDPHKGTKGFQEDTFIDQGMSDYVPHPEEAYNGSEMPSDEYTGPEHQFREYDPIMDFTPDWYLK